ncbi:MAG: RNA polymerase sigma factor [Thermomicrobiales bacterium]
MNGSGATRPLPLADLADEELVAHTDRHAAFAILYDRYTPSILGYCRLRIGNLHDAEDTAALILLKAFAGFPPDQRNTFRAWLFTIAHHTKVDFYRRSARSPGTTFDLHVADHVADGSPTPEEHMLRNDEQASLRRAMSKLTDDQRQVIELRLAGLKGAEIASVIGRSHNSVKMLQHRALNRLRAELTSASTTITSSKESLDAS